MDTEKPDIGGEINKHYEGQHEFRFSSVEILEGGTDELEKRVVRYLLPDIDIGTEEYRANLGSYLAFRLYTLKYGLLGKLMDRLFVGRMTIAPLKGPDAS